MNHKTTAAIILVLGGVLAVWSSGRAQSTGGAPALTYILFYRTWDAPAAGMAQLVKTHASRHQANWKPVSLSDPAHKHLVDQYEVSRAPMPLLVAVHANGAVTGAFANKVTEAELDGCLVSPVRAQCVKCLQQNQLVLLCVQTSPLQSIPQGVRQFQADPHYATRTQVLTMQLNDPNEADFIKDLSVDPRAPGPFTVLFAPPGVVVGKFSPNASGSDLATALHKAGKCCNDPNCKHNHK